MGFFARPSAGAEHAFGIELHGDLAVRIDGDHASFAVQRREFIENDFAHRGAE